MKITETSDIDAQLRNAMWKGRLDRPPAGEPEPDVPAAETPRPSPLPGGAATPHYAPVVPSGDALIRGAIAAAKGEGIPHHLRPFIRATGTSTVVTGVD